MATRKKASAPWKRRRPARKRVKHLTARQRRAARERARHARRQYPNLIDNMWAASKAKS